VCIEVKTISLLQSGQVKGWSKKSSLTGRTAESYQKWLWLPNKCARAQNNSLLPMANKTRTC
jgi:hypothetical protein